MPDKLRALLVEDSEDDARLLVLEIRRGGYDLVHERVETAAAMREALRTEEWDVVLCDYELPGFGALAAMAVALEDDRDLPFIVVSGIVAEETAVEVLKAGAHDFVLKDRLARLVPAIRRELREAELRRERRQALEDLKLAVKARDEFLSIASHELKTPLTALELQVTSAIRLLRRRDPSVTLDRIEAKLATAARQVERLTLLINNLLDVARITSERLSLSRRHVDLRQIVRSAIARSREAAAGNEASIVFSASSEILGFWDPLVVEQIASNLLSNAAKFGGDQPIEVTVSADPENARLVVTDHGIGIEPEAQERIFRRFERAVPDEQYGGFGIGLWVARQAAEAHGGRIRVSSTPGAGSTFVVDLPRELQRIP